MSARLIPRLAACALASMLAACAGTGGDGAGQATQELKTISDMTPNQKRASVRLQLAVGYYQDRKYEVALDEVKQAIEIEPNMADAYSLRALIYTGMNQFTLAEENYEHALRLAPDSPEIANNYGSFLCQTGKGKQAIAYFERALNNRTYNSPVSALINAGTCSMRLKNYDAAERYLMDALRLAPDLAVTSANLARVFYEKHDYNRAAFFFSRLLEVQHLERLDAESLWLGIRIERKIGGKAMETTLVSQLSKQYPASAEYAAFQRGAFDE